MYKAAPAANIGSINHAPANQNRATTEPSSGTNSFAEVLEAQQRGTEVKLSAHAQKRLEQQNITISSQDITRIGVAAQKAEMKGAKESLMLLKDLALVVNIRNRTVITAVDKTRQRDKIFTNIDSTVIL